MKPHSARLFRPWTLVLILGMIYLGVILIVNSGDPKTFVTLGDCFSQCAGLDGEACDDDEGYDGQFAYYIARDPVGSPDCLDMPAYRLQRILLPALGRALSLGHDGLIPWAFVIINLAALVIGTALVERLLITDKTSRWFALSYGLFIGVFMAVRLSTNETLAYGLVIAGIWYAERDRPWQAAILLALAGLAKETTGLFTAGYLLFYALRRRWRDVIRLAVIVGVPFAAWQIVLYDWLGAVGIGSGGAKATPFEIIPYNGVWRIAFDGGLLVFLVLGALVIPAAVLPSLWALRYTLRDLRLGPPGVYACLLLVNAAIMPFVPFSTYREYLGLLRFMPGLVLMVVLYAARYKHQRPLLYSTLWIVLLLFLVVG
ncbi:MAG: DUF2029 domain-containing protein [Anaerolineae bacterium]|nr:DUF2029 domain-containing protein [Anaerolineae bacterium]